MTIFDRINLSKNSLTRLIMILFWAICTFLFLQTQFSYHFLHEEQDQLFIYSADYIQSYFSRPAWMACLSGDFITQFYYYIYAAPAILVICLLCMGDIFCRCLNHCTNTSHKSATEWICFCLSLFLMILCTYFSINTTYKLSNIIAIIGGCFLWWSMDSFKLPFVSRLITELVFSLLSFWLFGYGVIFFIAFELIRLSQLQKTNAIYQAAGIAVIIIILAVTVKAASSFSYMTTADSICYPNIGKFVNYDNEQALEQCYHLDTEYYYGKYNNVTRAYEDYKGTKIDEMNFYYCLSLEQLGLLPSKITEMQNPVLGTFLKISDQTPMYTIKMINDMYFMLGDMTYTERAALLANTFSPNGRNVRMIKRLAEANLINGDYAAAMKYLRLLSKTLIYRKWAKDHTPGTMSQEVKGEIELKHQFINKTDNIRLGDDCYTILTQLLDSNPKNAMALDYLLASDMLSHQREVYIRDYEKYGPSERPIFQEIYNSAKQ